jgi:hypothetical protein
MQDYMNNRLDNIFKERFLEIKKLIDFDNLKKELDEVKEA